jgi:putative transposase
MSRAPSPFTGGLYGLARVCRVWRIARSSVYAARSRLAAVAPVPRKRGPKPRVDDATLLGAIREVLEASPFYGEGYRKVWARLRHRSIRVGKERVRRLMRVHGLQAPHRVGSPRGPKAHEGTIVTERVNEMWGTDLTTTVTLREGTATVFIAVDHCSAECVGIHAAKQGNRFEALEPIHQGVREHFGAIGDGVAAGLSLRHDHGSQYLSDHFQEEIRFLGLESSPAFVREPEGNGCSERFIRVLKENLLWVRTFETVEELRQALLEFRDRYNWEWLIERHGFRPPAAVRQEQLAAGVAA